MFVTRTRTDFKAFQLPGLPTSVEVTVGKTQTGGRPAAAPASMVGPIIRAIHRNDNGGDHRSGRDRLCMDRRGDIGRVVNRAFKAGHSRVEATGGAESGENRDGSKGGQTTCWTKWCCAHEMPPFFSNTRGANPLAPECIFASAFATIFCSAHHFQHLLNARNRGAGNR